MVTHNDDGLFDELSDEFASEIRDLVDAVEPDFLAMEKNGDDADPELINRAFRSIHSIKGSAGFAGFETLKRLSHAVENMLVRLRDGHIRLDPDKMDAMLAGMDKMRIMANDLHASHHVPCDDEIRQISEVLGTSETALRNQERPSSDALAHNAEGYGAGSNDISLILEANFGQEGGIVSFEVEKAQVASAMSSAMYIFGLWADTEKDIKAKTRTVEAFITRLEESGRCLVHKPAEDDPPRHYFLFGTILDTEFLSQLLDIPKDQVYLFDRNFLSKTLAKSPSSSERDREKTAVCQTVAEQQTPSENRTSDHTAPPATETIRVSLTLADRLMNLVGEMVLSRNQLHRAIENFIDENPLVNPLMQNLNVVIAEVQENIMQMRMQPVRNVLNKFPRLVRDMSRQLSKEVDILIEGESVELDKSVLEGLSDPLTHLVRNCVDHGIEMPETREEMGKPGLGKIHLRVFHEGGRVNITIKDDGRGIDADKVASEAMSRGLISLEQTWRMSEGEKLNLIFLPGLSTAKTVTEISGRGVGMDVVRTNINKLGGHVDIRSAVGKGTTVHVVIPLTLAIIPSLMVGAGEYRFAIPQINVQEVVSVRAGDPGNRLEMVGGSEVLRLREGLLPVIRLAEILGIQPTFIHPDTGENEPDRRQHLADQRRRVPKYTNDGISGGDARGEWDEIERRQRDFDRRKSPRSDIYIVVLRAGMSVFGLHVNYLFDNEEIVVKPLSKHVKDSKCFAGATIMGDGRVAMILDAAGIASHAQLRFGQVEAEERRRREMRAAAQENLKKGQHAILVFTNDPDEYFAMPLAEISRLEMTEPQKIERVGNQEFLSYRHGALPLIRLEKFLPIRPIPEDAEEICVIIPKTWHSDVGIIASRILDTTETDACVKKDATTVRGVQGSAIIDERLVLFLDTESLITLFEERVHAPYDENGALA